MLLCFLPAFCLPGLSSLFRCLSPFHPSGFSASLVSDLFHWDLLRLSCLPSRLVCFTIGLLFSLLVPGFSFLLFAFSLYFFLFVPWFSPFSGGPLSRVLPLPVWFISFGRCLMLFLLWCFLSLPCVPGFSRIACVFFAPRSFFVLFVFYLCFSICLSVSAYVSIAICVCCV